MPLTDNKITAFLKKVTDLTDTPSESMTPADIKAWFDSSPEELRVKMNSLIDGLVSKTTDSGAKNIGVETISGLTGNDVQTLLQSLKAMVDGKTTKTGNHEGTWQGVNLGEASEAINGGRIDVLTSQLAETENQMNTQFINAFYPPAPLMPCIGDGIVDDYPNAQAMVNYFEKNGGRLFFPQPSNYYRMTRELNILNAKIYAWGTLEIFGESAINTQIKLENNSTGELFRYDNGTKRVEVLACSMTSGSAVVTTTGDFISSGIEAGMIAQLNNFPMTAQVASVDSATQITLTKTATATGSGDGVFYKLVTHTHRLIIRDLYLKNNYGYSAFSSWHPGTGIKLWGTHDSIIENVRVEGFSKGLHSLGGFINRFDNVCVNKCYDGFVLEYACYATNIVKPIAADCGANSGGYSIRIINSGSIKLDNMAIEVNKRGVLLEGVRGFEISSGNIESTNYGQPIELKKLSNIDASNEKFWTSGGIIKGLRFYESLGLLVKDGVSAIKFIGNCFEGEPTTFSVNAASCIASLGDFKYMKDIDYSQNYYYTGGEPNRHVLSGTLASGQSFSREGKKLANAVPYYGKYWRVGDIVHNSSPSAGSYIGWVCTTASNGTSDGSAVWKGFGAIQA